MRPCWSSWSCCTDIGASYLIGPVVPYGSGSSLWHGAGGLAGVIARLRSSLPAALDGPEEHPYAGAQKREVGEHLHHEHDPGGLGFGADVPEAHRREDGHREVQGVRAGHWLGEA